MNQLTSKLHSLLFVTSKPLTLKQLAKFTHASEAEVSTALEELAEYSKDSGVVLLNSASQYQLATNSENSNTVTNFLNSDLREQITEATAEVLAIIAYRQPITKVEIESIRGVNSQYSIRALLMRGLIEKVTNLNDARSSMYQITTEFLQQLGIASIEDLPSFEELTASIKLPDAPVMQDSDVTESSAESPEENS
ncbi:MAG TPA: SMC-Scp complex subunit ScpB [Candidatus Doudnabacteria bacterium]|nr:SMC-Scp complex subunit ScpB [Candidatus Doudnabacteria bacterium]